MAQVPYNPVPDQRPIEGTGGRSVSVNASALAFGGAVGEALKGLGATEGQVGNELFSRAIALQELRNETEARAADAQYMETAGQLHANFNALEGKARVDAFPGHMEELKAEREKIRNGLSNPMAQKMFDSQSLSTMGRTIFNAAGAAASANKQWATGTIKSQIDLDAKTIEDNPSDDVLFQNKLNRVKAGATNLAHLQGFEEGGPEAQDLALKATSQMWKQRIIGLSRSKPFEAQKMLEDNKTSLTQDDYLRVDQTVTTQGRAVGAANIGNGIIQDSLDKDGNIAKPLATMEQEARDKAKALNPDDPILAEHAATTVRGLYNQSKYARKQEDLENLDIVRAGYEKGVRDVRELRADPKTAAAMDALPVRYREMIPSMINRFNEARDKTTNQDSYQRLYGLSNNDVEGFLNTDVTKEQLSQSDMRKLQARQEMLKKNQNADPRVSRALSWVRGAAGSQMEALGIYRRNDSNKDDYDHFTGALQSALDEWQETHSKPPDYKEVTQEIAPRLMKQRTEPYLFGLMSSKKAFFQQEVPDEVKEQLKSDVSAATGSEPSDEEMYKAYVRQQYIQLYGSKKDQSKVSK